MSEKKIVIIAGPNGSGKTTFAQEYLPHEAGCSIFLNADLIACGLSPFQPENATLRAGKLMLQEMESCIRYGKSFAFETTLSGKVYAWKIPQWRALGYKVKLIYLSLPNVEMALARVASRVALVYCCKNKVTYGVFQSYVRDRAYKRGQLTCGLLNRST